MLYEIALKVWNCSLDYWDRMLRKYRKNGPKMVKVNAIYAEKAHVSKRKLSRKAIGDYKAAFWARVVPYALELHEKLGSWEKVAQEVNRREYPLLKRALSVKTLQNQVSLFRKGRTAGETTGRGNRLARTTGPVAAESLGKGSKMSEFAVKSTIFPVFPNEFSSFSLSFHSLYNYNNIGDILSKREIDQGEESTSVDAPELDVAGQLEPLVVARDLDGATRPLA